MGRTFIRVDILLCMVRRNRRRWKYARKNVRKLNSRIHFTEPQDRFTFKCLVLVMHRKV
jgi:hypothetical protein